MDLRTENVTYYVANDGTRFTSPKKCQEHETLSATVALAMFYLPELPKSGFIQLEREQLFNVRRQLWKLVLDKYGDSYPEWRKHNADDVHPMCGVGRVLSDGNSGPIEKAWARLGAVNFDNCRLYSQPFYALNPDKCESA